MQPPKTRWLAIGLLILVGISAAMQFAKVSTVFAEIAAHYRASDALAAWFVSMPALATILFGLPGSVLAARLGFRRVLLGSLLAAVVFSLLQALLPALPLFFGLRVLDGLVQLGLVIACPVLIIELAEPRHRALAMSFWGTFFGLAFALAGWVAPALAAGPGLGAVFAAHALFALVLLVAVWFTLPRVPGDGPQPRTQAGGGWRAHLDAYRDFRSFLPGAVFVFHTALYAVFVLYLPLFAGPEIGGALLVWLPLVSIAGTVLAGVLAESWLSPAALLLVGFLGLAGSLGLIWLGLASPALTLGFALLLMLFSGVLQGAAFGLIPALSAEPTTTSRANGVLMQLGNLGTLIGPPLFALIVVRVVPEAFAGYAVLAWLFTAGGALVSLLALRRVGLRPRRLETAPNA